MAGRGTRAGQRTVKPAANAGLTLYASVDSVESDWARLVLGEKEVEDARVTLIRPGQLDEDLAVLNPAQSLPTLVDREGVLTGGWVISEYLDERYPQPRLTPTAPSERARLRMALRHIERDLFPMAERSRIATRGGADALQKTLVEMFDTALRHMGAKGWFLGYDYNIADCASAVLLHRLPRAALSTRPALAQYAQRLFARKAFRANFAENSS